MDRLVQGTILGSPGRNGSSRRHCRQCGVMSGSGAGPPRMITGWMNRPLLRLQRAGEGWVQS